MGRLESLVGLPRGTRSVRTWLAVMAVLGAPQVVAQAVPQPPQPLSSLSRPEPPNLFEFVANKEVAITLGKALFWDMQVGSDGRSACASCHFHAGADPRSKNQVNPGLERKPSPDTRFNLAKPNQQLRPDDFPFHGFSNPDNASSRLVRTSNDIVSSQGVFSERFTAVVPGQFQDLRSVVADSIFRIATVILRKVEPRNTPTVINAVFNHRNLWDGRANYVFNGVNPFGKRDVNARVYKAAANGSVTPVQVVIPEASLASQASGPPLSDLEMSAAGRTFPQLARKMLSLKPLGSQRIAHDDSRFWAYRGAGNVGLSVTYDHLIRSAFRREWWSSTAPISLGGVNYTQTEANFSLFFGLALQLYQATLVSDQTPFDRYAQGYTTALTSEQQLGLGLFWGKAKCANCHGGPAFTNAAIKRQPMPESMSRMVMANAGTAVYDEGFYNIGVTPTHEDLGLGNNDPFGNPMSLSGVARLGADRFAALEGFKPNLTVGATERIAVRGAFKTPGLRNVELTAPYFHNGSAATLLQVVEFYNRGGNFRSQNIADLDADIQPLNLSHPEKLALVAFMRSLTDERVRKHAAPFDHPELLVPMGHVGDTTNVFNDGKGLAVDDWRQLTAVGWRGYAAGAGPSSFLGLVEAGSLPNLAQGRPSIQSSTLLPNVAGRATDGVLDGLLASNSVSSTNHEWRPWWQVDLGAASSLALIELWNRTDTGTEQQLRNFVVFVSDTDMAGRSLEQLLADPAVGSYSHPGGPTSAQLQIFPPRGSGRYVRIQLRSSFESLSLAEVRVFGTR